MADTGQGNAIIGQHVGGAYQLVKNSASYKLETRDWGLNLAIAIKEEEAISERVLFALWLSLTGPKRRWSLHSCVFTSLTVFLLPSLQNYL